MCCTDPATQGRIRAIFEFAASRSDEIVIDDFWFAACTCATCDADRRARTVTLGGRTHPVDVDTWEDYRCERMAPLSRENVRRADGRRCGRSGKISRRFTVSPRSAMR